VNKILLFLLAMTFFIIAAPFAQSTNEILKLTQENKAILIDVREAEEIAHGMLKGAKSYPLSKMKNNPQWSEEIKKMSGDKKIFLYCRSGGRAGKVQDMLKEKGIKSQNIGGYMTLKDQLPTNK